SVRQGLIDDGVDYLQSVSAGDNMLGMSTAMALGFAYEEQGDHEKAASTFESAANIPAENDQTSPTMLFNAGRNYELAGNLSKARSLYQKIKEVYPNSSEGLRIDKYLGRVSE
ncbi:MAG: tetratricopeptide repeat protein, partial [Bacteroidota bacterium]